MNERFNPTLADFIVGMGKDQSLPELKPKNVTISYIHFDNSIEEITVDGVVYVTTDHHLVSYYDSDGEILFAVKQDRFISSKTNKIDGKEVVYS